MMKNNSMGDYYFLNNVRFFPQERTLLNDESGEKVALTNISAKCLLCFCERYEELIRHDELIEFVWDVQHKTVQYNSLYQTLLILRRSLVQVGLSQETIRTLPRKGFIMSDIKLKHCRASESVGAPRQASALFPAQATANREEIADTQPSRLMPQSVETQIDVIKRLKLTGITLRLSIASCLAVAALLLIVLVKAWHFFPSGHRNFFNGYVVAKDAPGAGICTWLYNSDATNFERHRQFSADHPELCNAQEAIYVTAYDTSRKISAVACSKSLTTAGAQAHCLSWYYPNRPMAKGSL